MPLEGGYTAVQGTKPLSGAGQATLTAFGLGIAQLRLMRHCGPGRWMRSMLKKGLLPFYFSEICCPELRGLAGLMCYIISTLLHKQTVKTSIFCVTSCLSSVCKNVIIKTLTCLYRHE